MFILLGHMCVRMYVRTVVCYKDQHTHTHIYTCTHTTEGVNSADFPCQLLGRHWFKETSICDVSTYLMNPLRSIEALVRYTACLHCFYVYSDSFQIHAGARPQCVQVCVCVCACSCRDVEKQKRCADVRIYSPYVFVFTKVNMCWLWHNWSKACWCVSASV